MTAKKDTTTPLEPAEQLDQPDNESTPRAVRTDRSYVPRTYAEAMTKEQREHLKAEGLL
jgi:hypothetical protein